MSSMFEGNLACCELLWGDEGDNNEDQDNKIQVIFRRQSTSWNRERGDTFSTSKSTLAYWSMISLDLVVSDTVQTSRKSTNTENQK